MQVHRFKGHHTKDYYQLKKEIEILIQERNLNIYVKGDFSHASDKSNSRGRDDVGSPRLNKENEASQDEGSKGVCHTLNIIAGGFVGGRETNFIGRRYARQIMSIEDLPEVKTEEESQSAKTIITFFKKDATGIHPHNDNLMVIIIK